MQANNYIPDILWQNFKITPEILNKIRIVESSVYLTRKCNLKCQYCKIIKTELPTELNTEHWIEVFDILEELGVRFVNIAGGEPTVVEGLGRLIRHLNSTTMEYSIVSNSVFNDKKLNEMVDAGLKAYVASVDVVDSNGNVLPQQALSWGAGHVRKSSAGIKMLERLKTMGVPYLCANIVISGKNVNSVMDVVRYLSDNGIWVNACPIIWGKGDKWEEIETKDEEYRLTETHRTKLQEIADELLNMKKNGGLILPTESYIKGIPEFGIGLNWKCFSDTEVTSPSRIIVDADGSLMRCINDRGETAKRFNIFDLRDKGNFEQYLENWWQDAKTCSGCYWSTMVMARERQNMLEIFKEGIKNGT